MSKLVKRRTNTSVNNLANKFPELLKEWDYDKNKIDPTKIVPSYTNKVYWKCSCGNEWKTSPLARTTKGGSNCPKCNVGGHGLYKDNYIDLKYPELLKYWDHEKNSESNIHYRTITCYSQRKAHWKCDECNHKFTKSMIKVTKRSKNVCPNCKKKKRYEKIITCNTCGYTWNRMDTHPCKSESIARKHCPCCKKNKRQEKLLKNKRPDIVKFIDKSMDLESISFSSNIKLKLNCPDCNFNWKNTPNLLYKLKDVCPRCRKEKRKQKTLINLEKKKKEREERFIKNLPKNIESGKIIDIDGVYYTKTEFCKIFNISKSVLNTRINKGKRGNELFDPLPTQIRNKSLAQYKPSLLKEWDYTKNDALGYYPDKLSYKSSKVYVNWKCNDCSHEWSGTCRGRTGSTGGNCPRCNSLAAKYPDLEKDWNYQKNNISPYELPPLSGKKYHWICHKCNHEWKFSVAARSYGSECPECSPIKGTGTSKIERRLFYFIKKIYEGDVYNGRKYSGKEIDILINNKYGIEYDGIYWHKDKSIKDELKAKYVRDNGLKLIRVREVGLEIVDGYDIEYDSKDSNALNGVLEQIVKLIPLNLSEKARYNKIIKTVLNDVQIPDEYMIYPLKENSLAETHPEMLKEWDYDKNDILPEHITIGQYVKINWKCYNCKRNWLTIPYTKVKNIGECKYCKGTVDKKYPMITDSSFAKEWNYNKNSKEPSSISSNSSDKYWWTCKCCGSEYVSSAKGKRVGIKYCPNHGCEESRYNYLGGLKSRVNENNSVANIPLLKNEWMDNKNGVDASKIAAKTNKDAWWRCVKCNHEWEARIDSRAIGKSNCPSCR